MLFAGSSKETRTHANNLANKQEVARWFVAPPAAGGCGGRPPAADVVIFYLFMCHASKQSEQQTSKRVTKSDQPNKQPHMPCTTKTRADKQTSKQIDKRQATKRVTRQTSNQRLASKRGVPTTPQPNWLPNSSRVCLIVVSVSLPICPSVSVSLPLFVNRDIY